MWRGERWRCKVSHFRGKHIVRAGTEVAVTMPTTGLIPHTLKKDLDVSDAAPWCSEESGVRHSSGLLAVHREDYQIVFRANQMVDVTPCTCGGKGILYEPTPNGKGGRGRCCLDCEFGKK
jgi:hypothetical protein